MPGTLSFWFHRAVALLLVLGAGALAYIFMPSCANLIDADDVLCHRLAAEKDGVVDWPDESVVDKMVWYFDDPGNPCQAFDRVMESPWWFNSEARAYIDGFGIAQGHNWGHLGRADVMTFNPKSQVVDTPLARTYNAYANIVYANLEGIELNRSHSLDDFEYYDSYLKWAAAYVSQKTYRVNGNCDRPCQAVDSGLCTIARTVSGAFRNDFIDLYQTFFYEIDAIWRASTIVHEVRHARDGMLHNGGAGCVDNPACDWAWSSNRANTHELLWLAAYYYAPDPHPFITDARRDRAKSLFNLKLTNSFVLPVLWNLDHMKDINDVPEFYVERVACSDDPNNPHPCIGLAD